MVAKLLQLVSVGVRSFMLAFDDVEAGEAEEPFGSAAEAQAAVANRCCVALWHATLGAPPCPASRQCEQQRWAAELPPVFLFCPTEYCNRISQPNASASGYLAALGRELLPVIDLCWTGDEIVSPSVTAAELRAVSRSCGGRRVVLWDNLHANDYDQGRRLYLGPYSGRDPSIMHEPCLGGIVSNPNVAYEANFIPLATLAMFVSSPTDYRPELALEVALGAWTERFGAPVSVGDVELMVHLFYLPFEHGPRASQLLSLLDRLHDAAAPVADTDTASAAVRRPPAAESDLAARPSGVRDSRGGEGVAEREVAWRRSFTPGQRRLHGRSRG
jgi:hypothetical protein